MDEQEMKKILLKNYQKALEQKLDNEIWELDMEKFCYDYEPNPQWAIGPFKLNEKYTFKKQNQLKDPWGIDWTSSFIFNPSLLVENEELWLFYRAAVKKESLGSRIGVAVYKEEEGWTEYEAPLIYPTEEDELLSIDDPKIYKLDNGEYIMFYNGVYEAGECLGKRFGVESNETCVNVKYAVSNDKIHWEKKGLVVPLEISKLWAKGAVIPRNGNGEAVKIQGKYMMFLSEGCGGKQFVGYSKDMKQWEFVQENYLELPSEMGEHIYEVACAIVGDRTNEFVIDFFYRDTKGEFAAGQALYHLDNPLHQLDIHKGGTLAWGGLCKYKDMWIYPQGWNAPAGIEEMYFYTCKNNNNLNDFFGDGFFEWQLGSSETQKKYWKERCYNPEKYWGGFMSREELEKYQTPGWALCEMQKYEYNPIFSPKINSWDKGHFGGGVHNGSIIKKDGKFYYIYRGEMPYKKILIDGDELLNEIDYICDIGVAVSEDGIHFERLMTESGLFRNGDDVNYSFEDVCVVEKDKRYYLFCNRWNWNALTDSSESGVFLAISEDLIHWEKKGLVFPKEKKIHRNACVLQNKNNQAVKVDGKYIMYLNNGLIAVSENLIEWTSEEYGINWPGGEGCFALTDLEGREEDIILFTGGHHTGHFYAIGEVLLSKNNYIYPKDWLQYPVLIADENNPFESGRDEKGNIVSNWRDTVFFTGLTVVEDELWIYYGGSEYYTCLAKLKCK